MICITADKRELYYEVKGKTDGGETLVFLNGLTQSTLSWAFVIPFFMDQYKIIVLDFIFQGQSDKRGEYKNFDEHAKDVISVLNQESIQKAHIIGLSYGSLVAQHMAVNHPDRIGKLILLSTFAHKTPIFEVIETSWWRALENGGYGLMFDTMMPFVLSEEYFANPIIPVELLKKSREDLNQNSQAIFSLMRATKERKDYRNELKKIKADTLIIQGEKDLLLPVPLAREVHQHIPHSQFIIVHGAGHTLNLEHVPEVCAYISTFLKNG